jgi:hypothetical protein
VRPRPRDLLLALVVAGVVIVGSLGIERGSDNSRAIDAGAFICGLAGAFALAGWRRFSLVMVGSSRLRLSRTRH